MNINTPSLLPVGTILHGTYSIESYLSSGGFGNTYVVYNVSNSTLYALKELFVKQMCQRDNSTLVSVSNVDSVITFNRMLEKFKKEASRLKSINNEHIVQVYDLFEENGTAYYVMDLIQGPSLGDIIKDRLLTTDDLGHIFFQIIDALQAIHAKKIWHLDIKPENILITENGIVKLIDFGSSKHVDAQSDVTTSTALTYTGGYAAPELYQGKLDGLGPWTDFYALGATLYKLSTGQQPPSFSDIIVSGAKAFGFPENIEQWFQELVVVLMNPNKEQRPQSCEELLSMFDTEENEDTVCAASLENKMIDGHVAIDLGLSVYWASMDIGASEIGQPGDCFLWGDPDGSKTHKVQTSLWRRWTMSGPITNNICGKVKYDTAMNLWGSNWRMPSKKDFDELFSECTWEQLDNCLVKIIGPNGNYIYLDSRWHWTGNSANFGMIPFAWENNGVCFIEIYPNLNRPDKDYVDWVLPIRPVADKK